MRKVKVAVATCVALAALAVSAPASSATHALAPLVEARIDAAAKRDIDSGRVAGVAVAVLRDGQLVFSSGYGRSNLELAAPVRVRTVFRIGSLTKQFTAAGVLLLAEQGKLKIDEIPAGKYPFVAWHEHLGEKRGDVEITKGQTAQLRLEFAPSR